MVGGVLFTRGDIGREPARTDEALVGRLENVVVLSDEGCAVVVTEDVLAETLSREGSREGAAIFVDGQLPGGCGEKEREEKQCVRDEWDQRGRAGPVSFQERNPRPCGTGRTRARRGDFCGRNSPTVPSSRPGRDVLSRLISSALRRRALIYVRIADRLIRRHATAARAHALCPDRILSASDGVAKNVVQRRLCEAAVSVYTKASVLTPEEAAETVLRGAVEAEKTLQLAP